jgi:hypothetical protein
MAVRAGRGGICPSCLAQVVEGGNGRPLPSVKKSNAWLTGAQSAQISDASETFRSAASSAKRRLQDNAHSTHSNGVTEMAR